jgi:sulfhydrogenase subunit beta (sulfur reductase)
MEQYLLKKGDFEKFVLAVMKGNDLIAPVEGKKEKLKSRSFYKKIDSPSEIFLDRNTYFPIKGFFFDRKEVLFKFKENRIMNPRIKLRQRVFFGVRRCDLNGIMHQDILFLEENEDPFYKARRDASVLIGLHCKEGGDYCFCNSFELKDFFDLMFYDKGRNYAIEVGSLKGGRFLKRYHNYFKRAKDAVTNKDKVIINKKRLDTLDIKSNYNYEDWKRGADKCLACGACNFLCPNCHCFSIEDEVELDLKSGKRVRKPASCQLRHFTRVAGDHIFRDSKLARFKHRIYHQIQYFKDRHDVVFCTGCGRCIEGCPARIDWVQIINGMKNGNKGRDN